MMLGGRELAAYIKERHRLQVEALGFQPKLAIIMSTQATAATQSYVRVKTRYAHDIGAEVDVREVAPNNVSLLKTITELNQQTDTNGIIVQLPIHGIDVDRILSALDPRKDVDGLHPKSRFSPATPQAIVWLLSGHGIEVRGKIITVVGQGRLVGAPLAKLLEESGATVIRCDKYTKDLPAETRRGDIVISATGQPDLVKPGMVKPGAVVVDAGSGEAGGSIRGDVDPALFEDESLSITPNPGGVGPMTVVALFDNLLQAAASYQLPAT